MDGVDAFNNVARIVKSALEPVSGVAALIAYLESVGGPGICGPMRHVDIVADVASMRAELSMVLRIEPPPAEIMAYYFGIYDTIDDDNVQHIAFYVAGVERYDPEDGNSLCSPTWFPESRFLPSEFLSAVKAAEVAERNRGAAAASRLLGYAGQLGAAALLTKFASAGLFTNACRIVGFDSGDALDIDAGTVV